MRRGLRVLSALACVAASTGQAQEASDDAPGRPAIMFNRWQEDWSVLADPSVPREPLDSLKYISLSNSDPKTYLSFGANLRERFESNDAVNFGTGHSTPQAYVISRMEVDGDLIIHDELQAFLQLQSDFAPGKLIITPVDNDRLGIEQGFVAVTEKLGNGTFKFRVGRQQIGFDLQRFVSVRDGPNIRQSYDALWADYEIGKWRLTSFYSQPVQNRDLRAFDDYSSGRLTYGGFRFERKIGDFAHLTATISQFKQDDAHFPAISGNEYRDVVDSRFGGNLDSFDWDIEAMGQAGHIAGDEIRAWAVGSRAGYTIASYFWSPRIGLQVDAASGNSDPDGKTLGTFNPLFPNGYYVTLSGYTGYTNFVHVKPSITVAPAPKLTVMLAVADQWRQTTADAVYTQPDIPVPGTYGHGGAFTGTYFQARADWQITPHVATALEAVRFDVANAIREVGGQNGNYLGVELRLGW
jgi:hypothetical protein